MPLSVDGWYRDAVGALLVFKSCVVVFVAERLFTVEAGVRASGVGGATRGGPRERQQKPLA
jgi:hypothetical protein